MGTARDAAIERLWRRACAAPVSQWSFQSLNQLSQVQITLRCEGNNNLAKLPSPQLQHAMDSVRQGETISGQQREVARALRAIGWDHREEERLEGGIVVDMLGR